MVLKDVCQFVWKGLEIHGKSSHRINDWTGSIGVLKRWLPVLKDRWEMIEERGSLIYCT
jgi:hypothetical protein